MKKKVGSQDITVIKLTTLKIKKRKKAELIKKLITLDEK